MTDRHIAARAMQIAQQSNGSVYWADACKQAIRERCGDNVEMILDLAVQSFGRMAKEYKKSQYNLPEQATLFDVPELLMLATPLGELMVHREEATAGQVQEWVDAGERHHGSQHKAFKAKRKQLRELDLDPSRNYLEQLKELRDGQDRQ